MVERYNFQTGARTHTQTAEFDAGLRAYMLKVYNYMASGVLLTGIIAMLVAHSDALSGVFFHQQLTQYGMQMKPTLLGWAATLSPLAFVMVMSFGINKLSAQALQMIFWAFAACFGVSLASIFWIYTDVSIARTFFITAASFGALSLYGYTTKKSLSGMGTFLMMGLFGLIIASVVNIFMHSTMLEFVISVAGVLIFAGLTAYDTQRIKDSYFHMQSGEMAAKGAVMGALSLYLDFINLFMMLLRLMGDRR
ncbi:Bax inhibitor-1/YccA family protein [Kordiimonas marina]|uniref:Bax inhibitor-1/YccA family protein n=1 Tax=Kordiimonas marina TaxID=2872312 RepID=UPI001FF4BF2E|nr:Bax inhibitor-1/YccA family protein [Kordiimonas marina]MCJ9428346.1 Bax inhibitor-1/YccA family protein [Kordiimonas marina]